MNPRFWRDTPVFVTGHTGFKGAWLSSWLLHMGARVTGYSLASPTVPNLFEQLALGSRMASIHGDVRDLGSLKREMSKSFPEVVIHMAAQSLVRRSYLEPLETYSTNVMGTLNVLEAIREIDSIKAVVIVTTDKCYENRERHSGYDETEPLGGFDPYSSSKACAEIVTASYRQAFFSDSKARVGSARAGNVIGGGDWAADRLIPDLVRGWTVGKKPMVRNPDAVRPWQHVLEPLHGYLQLAERLSDSGAAFAEAWNFGPDEADHESVRSVADRAAQLWGGDASWISEQIDGPHEAGLLKLDSAKARARLGWRPVWGLQNGLAATIEWYKAQSKGQDVRALTDRQIEEFAGAHVVAGKASA